MEEQARQFEGWQPKKGREIQSEVRVYKMHGDLGLIRIRTKSPSRLRGLEASPHTSSRVAAEKEPAPLGLAELANKNTGLPVKFKFFR